MTAAGAATTGASGPRSRRSVVVVVVATAIGAAVPTCGGRSAVERCSRSPRRPGRRPRRCRRPGRSGTSMSWRTLAASTPAHFSLVGTKRLFSAASAWATAAVAAGDVRQLGLDRRDQAGLGELLLEAGRHQDLEQVVGQLLVLAVGRDADVRAAEEHRSGRARRGCRAWRTRRCSPSISGQPSSALMIWPGFQPGAGIMPTSPAQNASQSLASSASAGAALARSKRSLKNSSPAIDSGESSCPTHWSPSLVAMSPPCSQTNDIAACQLLAGQVDAREVRDVGVVRLQLLAGGDHLVERGRDLDARLLEEVLAVDHDAGAGVVRHGVQLAVVGAGLEQALQEVVAAELGGLVGEVDDARPPPRSAWAWVLPNSTMSGASLPDSAVVCRSTMPVPLLALELRP